MQIVRTYWGTFPQRDITEELNLHPDWTIQTMTSFVYNNGASDVVNTIVVYNAGRPVVTLPEPMKEDNPWDWNKKTPKVGDWPPGITPTVQDPLLSVSTNKGE